MHLSKLHPTKAHACCPVHIKLFSIFFCITGNKYGVWNCVQCVAIPVAYCSPTVMATFTVTHDLLRFQISVSFIQSHAQEGKVRVEDCRTSSSHVAYPRWLLLMPSHIFCFAPHPVPCSVLCAQTPPCLTPLCTQTLILTPILSPVPCTQMPTVMTCSRRLRSIKWSSL